MQTSKARCSAFDKAVNLLAFKDRTVQEIRQKLNEKGYSSEDIEDTVEKLSYYGYLNDQNYTISYIKDNTSKKGKKLIINELNQKGVEKTVITEVYESMDVDEIDTIKRLVERRFQALDFNDDKSYRRVVGYLLRRGFSYDNIKKVIKSCNSMIQDEVL